MVFITAPLRECNFVFLTFTFTPEFLLIMVHHNWMGKAGKISDAISDSEIRRNGRKDNPLEKKEGDHWTRGHSRHPRG